MTNLKKIIGKLVGAILVMTLLTACATMGTTMGTTGSSTACHATGDAANPYEEITITHDIFPVPVNGCPTGPVSISDGKITICHATDKETEPYEVVTVSLNGLNGHGDHEGDLFPAQGAGCPKTAGAMGNGRITICHATGDLENPYEEITVSGAERDEHLGHPNDLSPTPVNGCPTSLVVITDGKITICHATSSEANPYNEIKISVNGLNGHGKHAGDIIPVPEGGCPASLAGIKDGKITICHATSSKKNSFNEITISVNGLNGHSNHQDDIIPAPEGGCPADKK